MRSDIMYTKIFIRTFPSTEECELFESILQTRWPELIGKAAGVRFTAWRNPQTPHISTVIWEFPDEQAQRTIEKLIDQHISKFTKMQFPICVLNNVKMCGIFRPRQAAGSSSKAKFDDVS